MALIPKGICIANFHFKGTRIAFGATGFLMIEEQCRWGTGESDPGRRSMIRKMFRSRNAVAEELGHIEDCLIPEQVTGRYFYRIPDDETFRIIEWVGTRDLVIPIQVHSHPEEAFHSESDDERAFVQHTNGISIVVPDFGLISDSSFLAESVVYSLIGGNDWRELMPTEVDARFRIVDG